MPADLTKLNESKQKIIDFIKSNGPSLPVQIARQISASPIFAAAFLSELYAEGKIKISNLRVGSSPLYFLSGQENLLENFTSYLNQKEKEAISLLKNSRILEDGKQEPAIRVALRAIKDFAHPLKVQSVNETKIIWKYFLINDDEVRPIIQSLLNPQQKHSQLPSEINKITEAISQKQETPKETHIQKQETIKHRQEEAKSQESAKERHEKPKKKPKIKEFAFPNKIKEYLASKDIELLEIKEEKKKDFSAKVRIDTLFGKQEYYLIAKDKKKLSDLDLILAHQKANESKILALLIAPGDLDKKAQEHMKSWKNLVKFEKVKL